VTSVRFATQVDVPEIVHVGKIMHAESPRFSKFPYSPAKVAKFVAALMASPVGCVIVADHPHVGIIGFYGGFVAEHFFSETKFASDAAVFVAPAYRGGSAFVRMAMLFEEWAKTHGAVEFQPGVSTEVNPDKTLKMYERLGYRLSGHLVVKDV
jgi:GNAT superfamily N-acetyltransferase